MLLAQDGTSFRTPVLPRRDLHSSPRCNKRCSGDRPICSNCLKADKICVYTSVARKKRPPSTVITASELENSAVASCELLPRPFLVDNGYTPTPGSSAVSQGAGSSSSLLSLGPWSVLSDPLASIGGDSFLPSMLGGEPSVGQSLPSEWDAISWSTLLHSDTQASHASEWHSPTGDTPVDVTAFFTPAEQNFL